MTAPAALDRLETALERAVTRFDGVSPAAEQIRYHFGFSDEARRGKRLRSRLVLEVAEEERGAPEAAIDAAVAVEIIHEFSLIHDDIQDGDRLRRNRPTVWSVWGSAQAINAGDALHALAYRVLCQGSGASRSGLAISGVVSDALLEVIRGQCLDLALEGRLPSSVATYLRLVRLKTAALIGASMEAGAISAGATPVMRAVLRRAGHFLGIAFQLRDDWLGVWGDPALTGKSSQSDLARRKLTYPAVAARARAVPGQQRELDRLHAEASPSSAVAMRALLEELGGPELTAGAARRPAKKAVLALSACSLPPALVKEFSDVAEYVAEREG
jgi:geranylgeranyl diphosphate synthase type I